MNNERMANFIYELRKTKNLTQKQLAEKLNITDKAVSKWERGLGYPDIKTLSSLAEILGVTTNELIVAVVLFSVGYLRNKKTDWYTGI